MGILSSETIKEEKELRSANLSIHQCKEKGAPDTLIGRGRQRPLQYNEQTKINEQKKM
jgi:hypothetical protein